MSDTSGAGVTDPAATVDDPCAASNSTTYQSLRIAAVFIILVTSLFGTLLPIALRRQSWIPRPVFEFAKFFGSGVIIATAFIHLLAPAFDELGSECLPQIYQDYDWAPAIAMMAVYAIFFAEIAAYRIGSRKMARLGLTYQTHADAEAEHGHSHQEPLAAGAPVPGAGLEEISPAASPSTAHAAVAEKRDPDAASSDLSLSVAEFGHDVYDHTTAEGVSQLIAVGVLEFGVILHSIIIGLTLAVNEDFITLFVVIIFHQMFEGLGLGSRLSQLRLPHNMRWAPYIAGAIYALMTPLGVAIGLGVRNSYNGNSATANAVSGILDALSAGILLYTGLVELLGHEILLNPKMMKASSGKLTYVFCCMLLGSGLMALLGRWA